MPVMSGSIQRNSMEVPSSSGLVSQSGRLLVDFQLPWHKMPAVLLTALTNKLPPIPSLRREMVRIVCADIHVVNTNPGRRQLRLIAEKIVNEYPDSFRDKIGEDVIGTGYDSLFLQLEERLNNLNRGKKSARKRLVDAPEESSSSASSTGPKKPCLRDRYGCVSWQPLVPDDETLKEKQNMLKTVALSLNPDKKMVLEMMQETYCLQRLDINRGLDANLLKENWPFLFSKIGIFAHVSLLTEVNLEIVMEVALLKYFTSNKKYANMCQRVDEAKDEMKNETPYFLGVILLLLTHFSEKEDSLIFVKDVAAIVHDEIDDLPATPCLIVFGTSAMTGSRFCLCINRVVVCDNITEPLTAVAMLFGVFYVFNLHYPDGASITLEFIQRSFCGINPQRGTKAARNQGQKTHTIHPKILSLTKALRDFTNQWAL